MGLFDGQICATALDSHTNMIVAGAHCLTINDTGHRASVNSFSKETGSLSEVRIVDAVCAYDCKKSGQTYLLVLKNALDVKSNANNLIPPFIMSEAGLDVNPKPKIHWCPCVLFEYFWFD